MDNLIFSLNATIPVFLLMVLGMVFKKIGWVSDSFAAQMNKFVFIFPLPVMLFKNLATVDVVEVWDFRFVFFCFVVTLLSIAIAMIMSFGLKDREIQGEFIQASYRSSAALLGIALINNIYVSSVMGPLMIIGSVPLYNIMAVVVLSFFSPEQRKLDGAVMKKTLVGIAHNPIIIGIIVGMSWALLRLPYPPILEKSVDSISAMATPMGLIAMGATFDYRQALGKLKPAIVAAFMKLVGYCVLFLPAAVYFGFTRDRLIAILIMLGSATTPSCFVMSRSMGHKGVLSSSTVMITVILSGFTITMWVYILRSFGLI